MNIHRIFKLLKIAIFMTVLIAVAKRFRGQRLHKATGSPRWRPLNDPPPPPSRTGPVKFADVPVQTWVEPVDGACPATHQVKGNASSGIFHIPGGTSYERTIPERCYASPVDAEADGFRQAKS